MLKENPSSEYDVLNDKPASKMECCKPDYETMIENTKIKLAACDRLLDAVDNLLDAIANLTGDSNFEDDMASDLIGVVREKRMSLKNHVDSLIAEQKKAAR